jgi:hypothetical protein
MASYRVPRSAARPAEALARAVVDHHEDSGVSLVGQVAGGIDGPHLVGLRGGDRAVVRIGTAHAGRTILGENAVLAHDPDDSAHRGTDVFATRPCGGLRRRRGSRRGPSGSR